MPARRSLAAGIAALLALSVSGVQASAAPVRIYAAGSLSEAMMALIAASGETPETFAKPVFGPAGLLGDRLQKGEEADLFASADLAAPVRVAAAHSGALVIPFVRNRMCMAAKPAVGLTEANMLDRMLAPELRLATSTPGNDPGGDYAVAVFDRADALRPGAGKILADKALHLVGGPNTMVPVAGRSPSATIFLGNNADLFVYYCSSSAGLLKEVPDLTNLPLPETLEVHPVYGMTVLSADPAAARFALFVLSQKGQAVLARFGFEPLAKAP
ncbi:MAG: substrate-binding domain-containing protein [Janthinobacterium lividum]